jgi:hypothetical protein
MIALIVVVALLLGGCTAAGSAIPSSSATGWQSVLDEPELPDPCSLLTQAEAGAVLGHSTTEIYRDEKPGLRTCGYWYNDQIQTGSVRVVLYKQWDASVLIPGAELPQPVKTGPVPISGLGDEAYGSTVGFQFGAVGHWVSTIGQINIRKGGRGIVVRVGDTTGISPDQAMQRTRVVAPEVLSRF